MKGKKFDAHEKHFKAKEDKLNKQIKFLEQRYQEVCKEHFDEYTKNIQLVEEITKLKEKHERLLEYSKLTDEDIEEAIKRDKAVNKFVGMFDVMQKFM